MVDRWSVQEAKAKLSRILALARGGQPQRIGIEEQCVVVSEAQWADRKRSLGVWLVESAPRGEPIELPSRQTDRGDPFANEPANTRKRHRKSRR